MAADREPEGLGLAGWLIVLVTVLVFVAIGFGGYVDIKAEHAREAKLMSNRDPRLGPVYDHYESPRTSKVCDGANLIYRMSGRNRSISVSTNDPQCAP